MCHAVMLLELLKDCRLLELGVVSSKNPNTIKMIQVAECPVRLPREGRHPKMITMAAFLLLCVKLSAVFRAGGEQSPHT